LKSEEFTNRFLKGMAGFYLRLNSEKLKNALLTDKSNFEIEIPLLAAGRFRFISFRGLTQFYWVIMSQ